MVKDIVKDTEFLSKTSGKFVFNRDQQVIRDLLDTAKFHDEHCAGLAAVQIGYLVKAFVVKNKNDKFIPYINPTIIARSVEKNTCEEGCLSLEGKRMVVRNEWIKMIYTDINGKFQSKIFRGYEAEAIQHEYDHLSGKLI